MRSSWRRSTALVLALTVAMLLGLAGMALAAVTNVQITDPTAAACAYATPGSTVAITANVTAPSGEDIYMSGAVGSNTASYSFVGTGNGSPQSFTVNVTLHSLEPEGWKTVSVGAYTPDTPTMTDTEIDAVCVDITPPPVPSAFVDPDTPGNDNAPVWSWDESIDGLSGTDHYDVQIALSEDNITWDPWGAADPATVTAAGWTSAGLTGPGFYKIQVRAVDKAGNASAYAESGVYQFDNAVPTNPTTATVAPPSPAQNKQPAWSWTASEDNVPGKLWQSGVKDNDFELTKNAEATGVYKRTVPNWAPGVDMDDGKYTVTVLARDNAGNVSTAVSGDQYILDTTAPPDVGAITGPTSPGNVKRPTWTWAAVDDGTWGSGIQHYKVQIKKGSDPFTNADPATVTGTSWTPNADLIDETYRIQVMAVDNVDLTSAEWTESAEYLLDTVAPNPATSIVVPGSPGTTKKPTWTWTAGSDGGSGLAGYNITVSADDGGNYGTVAPAFVPGESWTPTNDLADGKYKIKVVAVDKAGNTSSEAEAATSYHLDTTPPSVPGTFVNPAPNPGTANNPTWTWTVCDDGAGVGLHSTAPYEVEISADGGATWAAAVPDTVNAASWTPSPVLSADGSYTIRVRSVDDLNNKSDWGVGGTYVFDTTVPTDPSAIIVTPASPSNNKRPMWSWTASTDAGSGVEKYRLRHQVDAGVWSATIDVAPASPTVSWTPDFDLTDGTWEIEVTAVDGAGNTSAAVVGGTYLLDATGPGVPHTFVDPTPTPGNDATPTWTWSAPADAGVGLHETAPYEVRISLNGALYVDASPATVASTSWTADPELAADGKYKIQVLAVDKLGNKSAYAQSGEYWLDTTQPVINETTWSANDNEWFNTGDLTFTVDACDPNTTSLPPTGSGLDKVPGGIQVAVSGVTTSFTADWVAAADTVQVNIVGAVDGPHTITLSVKDAAGNVSEEKALTFNVDTRVPGTPAASYPPYTNDTTPEITWTESTDPGYPDTGSGVVDYEVQIGTTSNGNQKKAWTSVGNVLALDWTTLGVELEPDGDYYFQLRAVDAVGWTSTVYEVTITVDTVNPVLANGLPTGYGNATPTISADFTDERSGLAPLLTILTLTYNGTPTQIPVGDITGDPTYTAGDLSTKITYTPSDPLAEDGKYTVDMTAYDRAGNKSSTLEWTFNVDTTPPSDPGEPYAGNAHDDGTWYINTLRPTFKWAASKDPNAPDGTPGSGLKEYWFQFGTKASKPMSNTEDTWVAAMVDKKSGDPVVPTPGADTQQWTPAADLPLAVGVEYAARVKALDKVNNATAWVDPPIIYDPHPPTAVTNLAGDADRENTRPTFTWTAATDAISGVDGYNVKIGRELDPSSPIVWDVLNMFVDFPDEAAGDLSWQIGFELGLGDYVISVAAQDVAGNEGPAVELGFVVEDVTGPAAPALSRLSPSPTNQTEQQWTWTTPFDAVGYEFGKSINGIEDPATWEDVGNTSIHVTNYTSDGWHYVKVRAYDIHGNRGLWSNAASVEIDRTPPGKPTNLAVTSPTTNKTPTWTWTGVSGAAGYEVRLDLTIVRDVATATSYTHAEELSDGNHTLEVRSYDTLGNKSAWCDAVTVTVDTLPPAAPAIAELEPGYNTSAITLEWNQVTDSANAITYGLQWATNAGFSGATTVTVTPDEPATPSHDFTFPAEDEYWFRVKTISTVNPSAGEFKESGWSPIVSTIYDHTGPAAPALMLLTPDPTNQSPQTWSWSAPDGAVGYKVWHELTDTWEDVFDTRTYQTTFSTTGTHAFKVKAYDWLDTESSVVERTVGVDMDAPAIPTGLELTEPAGTTIGTELYTADETPKVKWNAVADEDLDHYVVEIDGQAWVTVLASGTSYTFTEGLADGKHTVKVKAVDELGNESAYSEPPLVFTVDITPPGRPDMPMTTPILTNQEDQEWTWNAVTDAGCGLDYYEVRIDGIAIVSPKTETKHITKLTDGVHFLQVRSVDKLGNTSLWSDPGYVTVDRTPPDVPVMKTLPPFSKDLTVRFEWTKTSADTDHYEISYTVDGENWSDPLELAGEFYVVGIADVPDGVAVAGKVRAYDKAGNKSKWSNELLGAPTASTIVDRTAPVVEIVDPTEAVFTNAAAFTYEWTAIDAGCGVKECLVKFNGGEHRVTAAIGGDTYAWTGTLIEGDNTFEVWAADKLGNVNLVAAEAAVVKQVKPQIGLVQPMPGGSYKINEISTIAFQVIGLYKAPIQVSVNGHALDPWRIVTVVNEPTLAKFYVLLDGEVLESGPVAVTITVGSATITHNYTVDSERSGFGFGRLRLW